MRKFKSIVIVYWILVIAGVAWGFLMLTGWSYPIKQVAKPLAECKSVHWDVMPEGCIIDLPKITWWDIDAYKDDSLYQLVYSDLWGGTYDNGWDVQNGSSPWVDIVSSKGTPVYAIGDGEVVQASYKWGIGNSVTIKHKYNGSYIYSSYSHLDEFYVKVGDRVSEDMLIGKVGNTGTTYGQYGNHLDFQLTTTTQWFYPYSYHDCNVWLSYYNIVNSMVCRSYMKANTIDPIAFLESNWSSNLNNLAASHGSAPIVEKKVASKSQATVAEKVTTPVVQQPVARTNPRDVDIRVASQTSTESAATIPRTNPATSQATSSTPITVKNIETTWTKKYQYQVIWLRSQETAQIKRRFVFFIKVYDVDTKSLHKGRLAHRIVIRDSRWLIAFNTPVVSYSTSGIIKVTALWLKKGYTDLKVEIAWQELGSYGITLE